MIAATLSCGSFGFAEVADAKPVKPLTHHAATDIADPGVPVAKLPLPLKNVTPIQSRARYGAGTFASTMQPLDLHKLSMSDFGDTDDGR